MQFMKEGERERERERESGANVGKSLVCRLELPGQTVSQEREPGVQAAAERDQLCCMSDEAEARKIVRTRRA